MDQQKKLDPKFSQFHGIGREKIDWHPKVDKSKCIGCGMCATTCGRGVYKFDYENNKSKVAKPNNCMVGCMTCSNLCPIQAISFAEEGKTPRDKAQRIVQEFQLIPKVAEELEKRKDDLTMKTKLDNILI